VSDIYAAGLLVSGTDPTFPNILAGLVEAFNYYTAKKHAEPTPTSPSTRPTACSPFRNGGELAVLFCFAFLLIAFTGAGSFALSRKAT